MCGRRPRPKEVCVWEVEGRDDFCAMLQAASAKAVKSTVTSGKGTVSTIVAEKGPPDWCGVYTHKCLALDTLISKDLSYQLCSERR